MPLEIKDFGGQQGGGDFDSTPTKVEPHKWINAENIRTLTTDGGQVGNVESIGSNVLINNPLLPIGNNTQIGKVEDEANARIIYFLFNDQGNHSIFCYDVNAGIIYLMLLSSQLTGGLNFDINTIIHSGFVANGCVYWCEALQNQPRKLNIQAAINLNLGVIPPITGNAKRIINVPSTSNTALSFYNTTYVLPAGTVYGSSVFAQLVRTGSGNSIASQPTTLQILLDWSNYPTISYQQVFLNGISAYLNTLYPGPGINWLVQISGGNLIVSINPTWDFGTGDSTFAPITSLQLQIYTLVPIYSLTPYVYTAPLDISIISWIKRQPALIPIPIKAVQKNPALVVNSIKEDAFQFCWRYIYRDYETGTLSGLSTLIDFNFKNDLFNCVDIAMPLGETIQQDVLQVDLVVKYLVGNTYEIINSWRLNVEADAEAVANHNNGSQALTYRFYNTEVGIALDAAYSVKPFDSVPIYAKTVDTGKNRGFMANYIIGYDTPNITSLKLSLVPATGNASGNPVGEWFMLQFNATYPANSGGNSGGNSGNASFNYTYYIIFLPAFNGYFIVNTGNPFPNQYVVPPLPTSVDGSKATFLGFNITQVMLALAPQFYTIGYGALIATELQYVDQGIAVVVTNLGIVSSQTNIVANTRILKTAAFYQGGITFYDYYGRKDGVLTNNGLKINTPDIPQYTQSIAWQLSNANAVNEIPVWAYYYSVDFTKCLRTRFFIQAQAAAGSFAVKNASQIYVPGAAYQNNPTSSFIPIVSHSSFAIGLGTFKFVVASVAGVLIGQRIRAYAGQAGVINPLVANQTYMEGYVSTIDPVAGAFITITVDTVMGAGTYATWNLDYIAANYCSFDISTIAPFLMGYVFTVGDVVKIITGNTFTGTINVQLAILGQVGSWIITEFYDFKNVFVDQTSITGAIAPGISPILFEIYTPYQQTATEPYFEDGNIQKISNPTTSARAYSQLSGNLYGDVNVITRTSTPTGLLPVTYLTENMSPDDNFWKDWFTDAGRPNFIDYIGQQKEVSEIAFSNTYLNDGRNNGLSTFDALDVKPVFPECGAITKLQLTSKVHGQEGSIMLAICVNEVVSLYLSEVQLVGSTDNVALAQATNVIGTINALKGGFGTNRAESVIQFRGNVYFYSDTSGKIIQYSDSGLFPISNYKMTVFWKLFSDLFNSLTQAQITALGSRPFVFAGIDPHNWELIFTVPKLSNTPPYGYLPDYPTTIYPFNIWDARNKSVVYKLSADPNFWMGSFSIQAEGWATVQNKLFAFKNGNIYQQNSTSSFCNFFGVQHKARLMFLSNQVPNKPKVYEDISVDANMRPSLTYFRTEPTLSEQEQYDLWEQASDLVDFSYTVKEGELYALVLRNKLVPTQSGLQFTGLLTAEKVRALVLKTMLEFSPTNTSVELRYFTFGYQTSIGHNMD